MGAGQSWNAGCLIVRPRCQGDGAEIVPEHRDARAVRDRLHVGPPDLGVAAIIKQNKFNGAAIDPARPVHFVDVEFCGEKTFSSGCPRQARQRGCHGKADGGWRLPRDGGACDRSEYRRPDNHAYGPRRKDWECHLRKLNC